MAHHITLVKTAIRPRNARNGPSGYSLYRQTSGDRSLWECGESGMSKTTDFILAIAALLTALGGVISVIIHVKNPHIHPVIRNGNQVNKPLPPRNPGA
jgi:hypothetical protein